MARIRSVKPEFPVSESVGRLSRDARLLLLQLIMKADDAGRLRGSSRALVGALYPFDDDAIHLIDSWLCELVREGCIRRYVVEGSSYVHLVNWAKHQRIDRPSPSRLPAPEDSDPADFGRDANVPVAAPVAPEPGPKPEPRPEPRQPALIPAEPKPEPADKPETSAADKRGSRIPADWEPSADDRAYGREKGLTGAQVTDQGERFRDHWLAKPGRAGLSTNWSLNWKTWVRNCVQWGTAERKDRSDQMSTRRVSSDGSARGRFDI